MHLASTYGQCRADRQRPTHSTTINYTPITHPHVWTLALVGTHLATRGAVRLRCVGGREGFSSPARHTHTGKGRGTPSRWQTRCYGTRGKACLPLTFERV
eukprot:scaffold15689_cov135-Isochrysis_galbana.AAC.1